MNTATATVDFDGWRRQYDQLTFQDQKRFYQRCADLYPHQQSWNLAAAREFMATYQPRTVVELGGWDGSLANSLIPGHMALSWRNYDIVTVPQACTLPCYQLVELDQPLWTLGPIYADAFVATHTIEHIKRRELEQLVAQLDVAACLIEAPLTDDPTDWGGYHGSHILEVGWHVVDRIFRRRGYTIDHRWPQGRFYNR